MTTSPLKVEDSRADFEKWMTDEQWFHGSDFEWDEGRNCYSQFGIHIAYKAWQASRAAIVVDIASHTEFEIEHMISPEKDGYSTGWIDGRNYATSQVRAAGITVKGDSDEANANAS